MTKLAKVLRPCQLRNGHCTHFGGGALETYINVQDHSNIFKIKRALTPDQTNENNLVHGQYLIKLTTVLRQCRLGKGHGMHFGGGALETFINVQDHSSSTLYLST